MMRIVIADDGESDELFAEIYFDDLQWAEVIFESAGRRFLLRLFPPLDREHWTFKLEDAERAIADARAALERRGYREQG